MDPLAHTLVSATLAQRRLRNGTATMAVAAGVLAANAPTSMPPPWSSAAICRRASGAAVRTGCCEAVLSLVLTVAPARARPDGRRGGGGAGRATRAGPLLQLTSAGVLGQLLLDWLNTCGVRFLMPVDGTWFYGDALFIIDP